MSNSKFSARTIEHADVVRNRKDSESFFAKGFYEVECLGADGQVKWRDVIENLVPNVGLNDILDKYWKGSGYTAAHYVGLFQIAGSPFAAAADTMASHAGWTEFQGYGNSPNVRQALTLGSVSGQSVDNSASKASFSINVTSPVSSTVDGCFITTDPTIGGTSGVLVSVGLFSGGSKSVGNGDTLNVTYTSTAAAG